MKVACRVDNAWGYSCCVVDLIWHVAKVNAKSERENDPNLSKVQIDQEAIKDNEFVTRVDFNVPQDIHAPRTPTTDISVVDLTVKVENKTTW